MSIIVKSRDSLLTTTSGYTNYRGILNLVIILLVLSNARAALENVIKYGILVDFFSWVAFFQEGSKHWPALLVVLGLSGHILVSLAIEIIIARLYRRAEHSKAAAIVSGKLAKGSPKTAANAAAVVAESTTILYMANVTLVANLFACITLPCVTVYTHDTHPISISGALMLVSIVFLKLVSYHMMNFWCRDVRRPEDRQSCTTKSFLRSYVPPEIEFTPMKKLEHQHWRESEVVETNGNGSSAKVKNCNGKLMNGNKNNKSNGDSVGGGDVGMNDDNNHHHHHQSLQKENLTRFGLTREEQLTRTKESALKALSKYPANLTFRNMCDFLSYPTLNYEVEFAKTERIRKRFLIKRIVELIILSQLTIALIQQWIVPTVNNSMLPFRQMQFSHMLERLLKLAIPNHVIWLFWFYLFFHSTLNIAAELTRFADREFYRDWWNSESITYFWSNWNIPVHKWCARHLYVPLLSLGLTKCQASTAVFFVSAFFHEYLVSVPLKMFRMWAFIGMLIQLPMAQFVSSYFNNQFANVAVWLSIIIGQPLCILMYYHDYYVINNIKSIPNI